MEKMNKDDLTIELLFLCGKCEKLVCSMINKNGERKRCPWRSISNDYCDFIENLRKEIVRSYNED